MLRVFSLGGRSSFVSGRQSFTTAKKFPLSFIRNVSTAQSAGQSQDLTDKLIIFIGLSERDSLKKYINVDEFPLEKWDEALDNLHAGIYFLQNTHLFDKDINESSSSIFLGDLGDLEEKVSRLQQRKIPLTHPNVHKTTEMLAETTFLMESFPQANPTDTNLKNSALFKDCLAGVRQVQSWSRISDLSLSHTHLTRLHMVCARQTAAFKTGLYRPMLLNEPQPHSMHILLQPLAKPHWGLSQATPHEVPALMEIYWEWLHDDLQRSAHPPLSDSIVTASRAFYNLLLIAPFAERNVAVSWLIGNYILQSKQLPPVIAPYGASNAESFSVLWGNIVRQSFAEKNIEPLCRFMAKGIEHSCDILLSSE